MKVDTKHPEFLAMADRWKRCRDFVAGSDAVKAAGDVYLPKLEGHKNDTAGYNAYKQRDIFFNGTARTVEGLGGLVMRIDPIFELPTALEELEADADYAGTSLFEFSAKQIHEVLTAGRTGILVDVPQRGENIVTQAQAELQGLRPYLAHYAAETILNWKTERRQGKTVLTRVVLMEDYSVATDDEFVTESAAQIRVLDLDDAGKYRQRVFRLAGKEWEQHGEDLYPQKGGAAMTEIQFVFIGPKHNSPDVQKPPILDIVNLNLGHYQVSADFYHGLHFVGVPTPVITGHKIPEGETIAIGSETFLVLSSDNAKASFLEFSGTGLSASSDEMNSLEQRMAVLGARMLMQEKKGVEAAETASIHRSGESGVLSALAGSVSKGIKRALNMAAQWAGAAQEVAFDLNRDFLPASMDSGKLQQLTGAWQSGGISHQVYYEALQRGEIIRPEVTFEQMKEDIDSDLPGGTSDPLEE